MAAAWPAAAKIPAHALRCTPWEMVLRTVPPECPWGFCLPRLFLLIYILVYLS